MYRLQCSILARCVLSERLNKLHIVFASIPVFPTSWQSLTLYNRHILSSLAHFTILPAHNFVLYSSFLFQDDHLRNSWLWRQTGLGLGSGYHHGVGVRMLTPELDWWHWHSWHYCVSAWWQQVFELEGTLWTIESSPCLKGTVRNQTPSSGSVPRYLNYQAI